MIKKSFTLISFVIVLIIILVISNVFFVSLFSFKEENKITASYNILFGNLSNDVLKYKDSVSKALIKFGLDSKYLPVILAIIQQESGGRDDIYPDIMQASEGAFNTRYSKAPNSIDDPEYSIECGVQEFKAALELTNGDVDFALQTYNFGQGFYHYAVDKGGYNQNNVNDFADMMAVKMGWRDYGDRKYVEHVMRYVNISKNNPGSELGDYNFKLLMQEALKHEGKRYNMIPVAPLGADGTPITFDCSSLVQYCYAKALGIQLPRTAQAQYDFCGEVNTVGVEDAKPGDLVFWTRTYNTTDFITHVAIYCGDYTIYEAGDPIGYSRLNVNSDKFVGFRRVYK